VLLLHDRLRQTRNRIVPNLHRHVRPLLLLQSLPSGLLNELLEGLPRDLLSP